eukprot:4220073-Pleurochrysis_carterae.AAC.1
MDVAQATDFRNCWIVLADLCLSPVFGVVRYLCALRVRCSIIIGPGSGRRGGFTLAQRASWCHGVSCVNDDRLIGR